MAASAVCGRRGPAPLLWPAPSQAGQESFAQPQAQMPGGGRRPGPALTEPGPAFSALREGLGPGCRRQSTPATRERAVARVRVRVLSSEVFSVTRVTVTFTQTGGARPWQGPRQAWEAVGRLWPLGLVSRSAGPGRTVLGRRGRQAPSSCVVVPGVSRARAARPPSSEPPSCRRPLRTPPVNGGWSGTLPGCVAMRGGFAACEAALRLQRSPPRCRRGRLRGEPLSTSVRFSESTICGIGVGSGGLSAHPRGTSNPEHCPSGLMTVRKGLFERGTRCIQGTVRLPCGGAGRVWPGPARSEAAPPRLRPACRFSLSLQRALEYLCPGCPISPGCCVPWLERVSWRERGVDQRSLFSGPSSRLPAL